VFAKVRSHNER